ncbi:kinase-like protein [Boletus reticuloceps]|uniref:Casein kinase II subunit alpha n=1 Tax=Boletus reticuloceps TaxID=495285 RepID=A0A8I2YX32_9AGAM|nr:kinase-like protein [Boletus reticuloceps]
MARSYADVNASLGHSWYDYENFNIEWSSPERYELIERIGGGRYSEVFKGLDMVNSETCVIKVLKPVAPKKIKREVKVLRNLTGGANIIALRDVVQDPSARYHSLVMEYVESVDWKSLFPVLNELDIKYYVFQLLKALDFVHSRGIMHRDVKPGNVMIDHRRRKLRLIDWGLAEFYHPGTPYHIRVGSRYYKAPELLVGYKLYDYSLDIWSVGCMLASMIFRKEHFFRGVDNDDQLLKILRALGTDCFDAWLRTYGIPFETDLDSLLQVYPKQPWSRYVNSENHNLVTAEVLDILDKFLRYDHQKRLTAREALGHSYFSRLKPYPLAPTSVLNHNLISTDLVRLEATSHKEDSAEYISDSGFCSM